jgi:hypothetical protein
MGLCSTLTALANASAMVRRGRHLSIRFAESVRNPV